MTWHDNQALTELSKSTPPSFPDELWAPNGFRCYQQKDYLNIFAEYGTSTATSAPEKPQTIMRLQSNKDIHLFGDLCLQGGRLRSDSTLEITSNTTVYGNFEAVDISLSGDLISIKALGLTITTEGSFTVQDSSSNDLMELTSDSNLTISGELTADSISTTGPIRSNSFIGVGYGPIGPVGGQSGDLFFNTSNNCLYVKNGSTWRYIATT